MRRLDSTFWAGKPVFVTGHMGFKGAWLCALLSRMGARTTGYGLDERERLLYNELSIPEHAHHVGDINDLPSLSAALDGSDAEVLFHLAAQPIVLNSYADPVGTFEANVMGTVRVLQAARSLPSLKAIVVVTTDKVYRNNEWAWGYREQDTLGGQDPYSASKAAAEIATHAMVASFFKGPDAPGVATSRAGNVIGGGDWADHRLLPDAARALGAGAPLVCRNPHSIRPWQHVLDPLVGYMMLAEDLAQGQRAWPALNFGPVAEDVLTVGNVADIFVSTWGAGASWIASQVETGVQKESGVLTLDSTLARCELGWSPRWSSADAVRRTACWYRAHGQGVSAGELVHTDITDYLA
ncbi:CDP-glucose 4,6-dehydratase [Hydrogenophaga sp. BPS33]|uniref:CDP-glucose 4,6-dehydratase n=1 Tax=Hydrogenophaga sp. BPS33 TaxID=2651974 RepID=UPI00131FB172|nr:CDP-glucose 4,6-dehydratase [Hydrogenophaga sp. BPS33]QHE83740.1 CDP-glucose 4,6-dehydratase [Hydrogenophaga sp. BPS33]